MRQRHRGSLALAGLLLSVAALAGCSQGRLFEVFNHCAGPVDVEVDASVTFDGDRRTLAVGERFGVVVPAHRERILLGVKMHTERTQRDYIRMVSDYADFLVTDREDDAGRVSVILSGFGCEPSQAGEDDRS